MKIPKVAIILLNYNGYEDTIACFESLQKITYQNYNIIIVDNNSPDKSMDKINRYMMDKNLKSLFFESFHIAIKYSGEFPKISLIQSGYNGGYGHGNNIGIKYALQNKTDYFLLLNNDTEVKKDFVEPMVEMCEKDKTIGIVSGKIYFYDRPNTIWFNGGKFSPCTAKVEHFNFNEEDVGQVPQEPITFISGCMWLIPKKVFDDVGFINEEYFMYVEDLEFCQRILDKCYKLIISDKSHILHKVGSSSGHWSEFFAYWMSRNKMKFIKKYCNGICKYTSYSYHVLYTSLWWLLHKRVDLFKAHIRGIYYVIKVGGDK